MESSRADTSKPAATARRALSTKQDARRAAVSAFVAWQHQRDTKRLTFAGVSRLQEAAERP
jgi:hypothetical protein